MKEQRDKYMRLRYMTEFVSFVYAMTYNEDGEQVKKDISVFEVEELIEVMNCILKFVDMIYDVIQSKGRM